jgi:N-methylhydantoinase A
MSMVLGIDIGGTFTDIVLLPDDGTAPIIEKVPSTPKNPAEGVINGLRLLQSEHGVDLADIRLFSHGSTVATNALLEFKLPRTALIVTKGFRDVLEIGSMMRDSLFDLRVPKVKPLVPREMVFEAEERLDREGKVVTALTDAEIERLVAEIRAAKVEACGISLLFSFYNADHERRIADALRAALPEVSVAISAEVAPEIKEYSRTSTVAVSSALQPLVARYMASMESGIAAEGLVSPFFVMQSSGGVMSAREASQHAHRMVLSGPAAGVLAAQRVAETTPYRNQITFDMGGTSTDICLIHDARARIDRESLFEGRPLRVPQFAIHTIGAGGGSLARIDDAGLLRVGPESAGALPGPVCYGRGGTRPTVTDAQVVLGRIHPDRFLGGGMRLDVEGARAAVRQHIAEPLGLTLEEAAIGILDIADAAMARGVRVVSVNKGYDPRDFALVPFGGAGPMHALSVGGLVDAGAVVIPPRPGTFSAVGLASSDVKYDFVRAVEQPFDRFDAAGFEALFQPLLDAAERRFAEEAATLPSVEHVRLARFRYAWQDNEVELLLGDEAIDAARFAGIADAFHRQHEFSFGHNDPAGRIELIGVGLEAYGRLPRLDAGGAAAEPVPRDAAPATTRPIYFRETGWSEVPVYERASLRPGDRLAGPAIVEEREATTIVTPGAAAHVDAAMNLVLTSGTA